MKSVELKKKYDDSLERVAKREKTIERQKKQLDKRRAVFDKVDWIDGHSNESLREFKYDMEARERYKTETGRELYWDICDVDDSITLVSDSYMKLMELKRISEGWREKYEKQIKLESTITFDMPEVFRECKEMLSTEWSIYDMAKRDEMRKLRKELPYEEYRKIYSYSRETSLDYSDEDIKKHNERYAEDYIIDLYNRVKKEVGEVTDWGNIYLNGKALNGYIEGKLGKVEVETILCGGWNVQKLHQRVILHKIR